MTLLRLVQRASILAGMTFASLAVYSNPAHGDTPQFCAVTSNGQTACGTLKTIERLCVTTDGTNTICGKFKSFKPAGQEQSQEARIPAPSSGYRKESDGVIFLLRSCKRSSSDIKCNLVITTKKENKSIHLLSGKGNSSIVDSAGKTYPSSTLEYNGSSSTDFRVDLSPGVDYVVDLNIENLPGQLTQAALVSIRNLAGEKVIQFRNIPFSN